MVIVVVHSSIKAADMFFHSLELLKPSKIHVFQYFLIVEKLLGNNIQKIESLCLQRTF